MGRCYRRSVAGCRAALGAPLLASAMTVRKSIAFVLALLLTGFLSRRYLRSEQRQLASAAIAITCALTGMAVLPRDMAPLGATTPGTANVKSPNVVLVVLDTVRADHLSLYGYVENKTPQLKEFAKVQPYTSERWPFPTGCCLHASMFTALYPRSHGATNYPPSEEFSHALAHKHQTLAEVLTGAGYLSAAVVANTAFVRPDYGLAQGFRLFDVREVAHSLPQLGSYYPRRLMRRIMDQFLPTLDFDRVARTATEITDRCNPPG